MAIRVIPEFDNPGHARAVGFTPELKDLILCFDRDWPWTVPGAYEIFGGPPTGILDPSNEKTYELVEAIVAQFTKYFPDELVHLGGDEVILSCFNENPAIATFMKEKGIASHKDLVSYHIGKAREVLTKLDAKKRAMYWSNEDTFYMKYKADDVLMYWGAASSIKQLKETYPNNSFVLAAGDHYYLDCGYGNKYGAGSWCDPFKTWW